MVVLESEDSLDALEAALESDPRLRVEVYRQTDYLERQSEDLSQLFYAILYVIGSTMAVGAVFGALNTMYSAIAVRTAEIATLRAIGFGSLPVVTSVLVEAIVLALVGAFAGVAIAWLLLNGSTFGTSGAVGQLIMELEIGGSLLATGVVWACSIGLVGGFFSAWRAARKSIPDGLRVVA